MRLAPVCIGFHSRRGNEAFFIGLYSEGEANMPAKFKRPATEKPDLQYFQRLSKDRPAAVYYRQSSGVQHGNISTTLQTVDMVEHLIQYGWLREQIFMIDMDKGVSGTKKIKERPGMSMLYELIERGEIGLVAAQDVDRFFRDLTQIETNIFIDACRRNNVMVMTPRLIYDFAHPTQGNLFIQRFREESQRAADFLDYHVKGRLLKSRDYLTERGLWAGRATVPGYMVDMREQFQNGERNSNYRKYVPLKPHADVMVEIFKLFREFKGNQLGMWKHMEYHGPFFPEVTPEMIPEGFRLTLRLNYRSPYTGELMPSSMGLKHLLWQVAYIGHWVHKGAIVQWNNHEAIIPIDLFMFAYNRLCPTDFYGDPNPEYKLQRNVNPHKETRPTPPPTYAGLIFSDDLPERPNARLAASWVKKSSTYSYTLQDYPYRSFVWSIRSYILDGLVDKLLLEHLKTINIDETTWLETVTKPEQAAHIQLHRLENWIQTAEQTKNNLITSLGVLTHPEMITRAQLKYEAAEREILALQQELSDLKNREITLLDTHPIWVEIISNWEAVNNQERRKLFEMFAYSIHVKKQRRGTRFLTIRWRDNTETTEQIQLIGHLWDKADIQRLKEMVEANVDQAIIMQQFPDEKWDVIQQRYAHHCNNGRWLATYSGEKKYTRATRWIDTPEYKASKGFSNDNQA
jgi:hypothetical protein